MSNAIFTLSWCAIKKLLAHSLTHSQSLH